VFHQILSLRSYYSAHLVSWMDQQAAIVVRHSTAKKSLKVNCIVYVDLVVFFPSSFKCIVLRGIFRELTLWTRFC
jgi:hypothetical protein